jgi:hypothetical protein
MSKVPPASSPTATGATPDGLAVRAPLRATFPTTPIDPARAQSSCSRHAQRLIIGRERRMMLVKAIKLERFLPNPLPPSLKREGDRGGTVVARGEMVVWAAGGIKGASYSAGRGRTRGKGRGVGRRTRGRRRTHGIDGIDGRGCTAQGTAVVTASLRPEEARLIPVWHVWRYANDATTIGMTDRSNSCSCLLAGYMVQCHLGIRGAGHVAHR